MELVKPTNKMRNEVFLALKINQKVALVLDCPVPQPELHQNGGPALSATQKGVLCVKRQLL